MDLLIDLKQFLKGLKEYKELINEFYNQPFKQIGPVSMKDVYVKDVNSRHELEKHIEERRENLVLNSGALIPHIKEKTKKDTIDVFEFGKPRSVNMWEMGLREEFDYRTAEALNACIDNTLATIGKLEAEGTTWGVAERKSIPTTGNPKAFIAHGGKSEARDKLCSFLSALGVIPLVIEEEPKEGRSVEQQVEYYLKQADCSIVLGTADDKELKDGKLYPRRNVHVEIGRFQERFPRRIIYLLEEGASFPSNISEKLYTRFSQQSMDEAFISVARELKAFGLLEAVKPETKDRA